MALTSSTMWILLLLAFVIVLCIVLLENNYNYWKKRGLDTPKYKYLVGNLWEQFTLTKNFGIIVADAYKEFKGYNYFGFYSSTQPAVIIRNPEIVGDVLVKDFSSFGDNDFDVDEKLDPIMGKNPFILKGDRWKSVRAQITPSFTTGKVKIMLPLLKENMNKLLNYMQQHEDEPLEAKLLSTRITAENVASCAFGLDGGSFNATNAKFLEISQGLLAPTFWNTVKGFIIFLVPNLARFIKMRFFFEDTVEFLRSIVVQTMAYRKDNQIVRNDFLDTMGELRNKINNEDAFGLEDILAHSGGFFLDGVETSANVISHAMYELARDEEIQERVRSEIRQVLARHKGDLTYEAIQEMEYFDCVFKENLRRNPPLFFMTKRVTKPYTLRPMREDNTGPCIQLDVGTQVIIPVYALHYDEEYFPEPHKFIPERFSAENDIPKYTYLPFSEGPRICLGMKFGILQSKIALITIINNYRLTVNSKTKEPVEVDPKIFINSPLNGLWLQFKKV